MVKTRLCILAAVIGLAGAVWAGQVNAAGKIGLWKSGETVVKPNTGKGPSVSLSGSTTTYHGKTIETTDGRISTKDGVLDAWAKKIVIDDIGKLKESAGTTTLDQDVRVSIHVKNGPWIKATAKKGQIDWKAKQVKLQGDAKVTSSQPDGSNPAVEKADEVTISWAEKLAEGQVRVQTAK